MRRLLSRLLDGTHPWGELRVGTTGRGTWRIYRLLVLPPGIDRAGRRAMRLRGCWPAWGGILWLGVLFVGAGRIPAAVLAPLVVVGYLGGAVIVFRRSRRVARACLRLSGAELQECGAVREIGDLDVIRRVVRAFERLDAAGLDPVAYEREWWRIYDALAAEPSGSRRPV